MALRVKFEPRDLWIGAHVDTKKMRLYVCVVPTLPLVIEPSLHGRTRVVLNRLLELWGDNDIFREGIRGYLLYCVKFRKAPTIVGAYRSATEFERHEKGWR